MFGIFKLKGGPKYAEPVNKILQQMERYPDTFSVKTEEYRRVGNGEDDYESVYTHVVDLKDTLSGYCFRVTLNASYYYVPFNSDHIEKSYQLEDYTGVEWADPFEARALYMKAQSVVAYHHARSEREGRAADFNAEKAARNSVMEKYFRKG